MRIGGKKVGHNQPTYFIADIASNHDGDLERAKRLIYLAAEAGADAVKFQNFRAETIVSDYGFKQLGKKSHQSGWEGSVFDTYKKYEIPLSWTPELRAVADECEIDYLTTPYDPDMVGFLSQYVDAFKIGSGDITYKLLINHITSFHKPILLATGASNDLEIAKALSWINNMDTVLMQCNTNYTGSDENLNYINLNVIAGWRETYGVAGLTLGLSDHTKGHVTVLGAVALGARVIEKHFTDDRDRIGPDHSFSMTPDAWYLMCLKVRDLEKALGCYEKKVEWNEEETVILQRRAVRASRDIQPLEEFTMENLTFLRPCPRDAIPPYRISEILGAKTKLFIPKGDYIRWDSD